MKKLLACAVMMGLSLIVPNNYLKVILPLIIILNYAPPFVASQVLRRHQLGLNLSSSMAERLGLFTIIIFGEAVLGVVNGISNAPVLDSGAWLSFALTLSIVFSLWWLFFTLTSNRDAKKGFVNASLLELLYLPTLMSLGLIAACLNVLFKSNHVDSSLRFSFGIALTIYFCGISLMMGLYVYPDVVKLIKPRVRMSLLVTAFVFLCFTLIQPSLPSIYYLLLIIGILIAEIVYLNSLYYALNIEEGESKSKERKAKAALD